MLERMTQKEFAACSGIICPACRDGDLNYPSGWGLQDHRACRSCGAQWQIKFVRRVTGYELTKEPTDV